jgi:hypothetical protein
MGHALNGYGVQVEELSSDDSIYKGFEVEGRIRRVGVLHFGYPRLHKINHELTLRPGLGVAEERQH